MVQVRASLLWVVTLGCIDLNQWYACCDDVNRPDYLHFDLDPGHTFAGIGAAVGIGVEKDQVTDANGSLEAEVDGEIDGGVIAVVHVVLESGLAGL